MKNYLSEKEQRYYLYVFNSNNITDLGSNNEIRLFQFADVHYKTSSGSNAEHRQQCDEITFVYSGEGEIITNDKKYYVKSGDVHLCFKDDIHRIIPSETSPLKFYCIGFTVKETNPLAALRDKTKQTIEATKNAVISGRIDLQRAFGSVLAALGGRVSGEYDTAVIASTLNYILSSVFTDFSGENQGEGPLTMRDNLVFYITSYLKNNVHKIDALSLLPEDTGYSYSYLSHIFSESMGQSLKEFFTTLRMNTATELLREKSVTRVSEIMGYSSVQAFTRAYKSTCNIPPGKINKS